MATLSRRGRRAKYCDSLGGPEGEERKRDICPVIFSSAHLSEFGIEEGYLEGGVKFRSAKEETWTQIYFNLICQNPDVLVQEYKKTG